MAGEMPEFEMPPAAEAPPLAPEPDALAPPSPEVVEPDPVEPDVAPAGRRRFAWKHLAATGVLALAIGLGVPTALEVADRAASADAVQELRATALEYVGAIAGGDSRRATQLVPVHGLVYIAPPEVLRSARPIEVPEVEVVHVEGDRGTVEVHYRVYGVDVFRTLQAERDDGAWQLRTSLAEVVDRRDPEVAARASIAGVRLGGFLPVMLYPGVYTIDEVDGPVLVTGGDVFAVDGDPRTPMVPEMSIAVVPPIAERAIELTTAAVEACRQRSGCLVPTATRLRFVDRVLVERSDPDQRTLDLVVGFTAIDAPAQDFFQMQLRLTTDEQGVPVEWECGPPGAFGGPTVPCGP
jgi:hypothetical protein